LLHLIEPSREEEGCIAPSVDARHPIISVNEYLLGFLKFVVYKFSKIQVKDIIDKRETCDGMKNMCGDNNTRLLWVLLFYVPVILLKFFRMTLVII
jgi:hypothetical protein